ncbi:DUF1501 domain-containing protein [Aquabacterium sp.]|uniref:DUF1501 domain-containing protein n=1 Tax=Aquabacterium sp. TaxID=1872578 RepID=UPI002E370D52|nr:DUF1501 domain-containing protein [Aquabacterium sp.]HEX5311794.1 DUF1501 domain-containing protein [Aquabacterium sp.]
MSQASRRAFLQQAATLSSLGAAGPLGLSLLSMNEAAAQSSPNDYKALVCIFLYGGNDAYNTVLATDTDSWTHYVNHRNPASRNAADTSTSIALMPAGTTPVSGAAGGSPARFGGVLPINHAGRAVHSGRQFALHPALPQIQQLHQSGRVAVLANVGPLTRPLTKADYSDVRIRKPAKLFSHNDQQSTWQSFQPEGAGNGWGGRMGDLLMGLNSSNSASNVDIIRRSFTCMTPSSTSVWLSGQSVMQYQTGTSSIAGLGSGGKVYGNARLFTAMGNVMANHSADNLYARDHQRFVRRAMDASSLLIEKIPVIGAPPWGNPGVTNVYNEPLLQMTVPSTGTTSTNPLAIQLQMVARLIETNRLGGFGIRRQLFMVSLGGFDTHDNQNQVHGDRLAQLNHAMAYFDMVLGNMPGGDMRSQVTTFTASDFGRTFTNNGDGTDHGWGAHHFIMGGAVRGTEVYGTFPQYSTANAQGVFGSPDQLQNGVMLPTTSVDQYAYTLGRWMGVPQSDLLTILPNLNQFNESAYDLGFMS